LLRTPSAVSRNEIVPRKLTIWREPPDNTLKGGFRFEEYSFDLSAIEIFMQAAKQHKIEMQLYLTEI
jgi:hypothetical protein